MPKFTVRQGKRYLATVSLGWIEALASNDMIARQIADAGFTQVEVRGEGGEREAEALWPLEDTTADIPSQISDIVEIA